jgi:histidine triad (HIT) family protein
MCLQTWMHRRATLATVTQAPCIFDRILERSLPGHFVLEEVTVAAFLDSRPVFKGHTLVVPRTHVETIGDLPRGVLGELIETGRRVAIAQRAALGCAGTFFALNDVVSQSVPHVHLHVIPRSRADGLRGFLWPRTKYAGDGEAAAVARSIREALAPQSPPAGQEVPHGVVVRDATVDDTASLVGLLAGGTLRASEDASDPAPYEAAVREIAGSPNSVILVAEVGGRVVGMCQLFWFRHLQERGGLCAEIESMHVDRSTRGRGIGAVLLEAAVERAEHLGCYRVQLTSHRSRTDAHRFYERHGFEPSHVGFKRYLDRG